MACIAAKNQIADQGTCCQFSVPWNDLQICRVTGFYAIANACYILIIEECILIILLQLSSSFCFFSFLHSIVTYLLRSLAYFAIEMLPRTKCPWRCRKPQGSDMTRTPGTRLMIWHNSVEPHLAVLLTKVRVLQSLGSSMSAANRCKDLWVMRMS